MIVSAAIVIGVVFLFGVGVGLLIAMPALQKLEDKLKGRNYER